MSNFSWICNCICHCSTIRNVEILIEESYPNDKPIYFHKLIVVINNGSLPIPEELKERHQYNNSEL